MGERGLSAHHATAPPIKYRPNEKRDPFATDEISRLTAHAANIYLHLKDVPRFFTSFEHEPFEIKASHPAQLELNEIDPSIFGGILDKCCGTFIDELKAPIPIEFRQAIRDGKISYLFDTEGKFNRRSMEPTDTIAPAGN